MKRILIITFLLFFIFDFARAEERSMHLGSIRGTVTISGSGEPLPGATVRLEGKMLGMTCDSRGYFQFADLMDGEYGVIVSFLGYATDTLYTTVTNNSTASLDFSLVPSATELSTVDIRSKAQSPLGILQPIDLKLRPVSSSQDILRVVPGLLIAQHAGGGKAEQIFMRGFDLDHGTDIRITVDDMPVNMVSHAHGQGYADLHFLIPETVEKVDISKGPFRAQDGNLATAGAVGFQTKNSFGGNLVKTEIGQYGWRRGLAVLDLSEFSGKSAGNSAYLAAEYVSNQSYFESPQDLRRVNVLGKYRRRLHRNHDLTLSLSTFQSRWDASGQIPQRAVDQGMITRWGAIDSTEGGFTGRQNLNLALNSRLADGSQMTQRVYASRYHFDLYSNFTFFLNDPVNGDQIRQREDRTILGYRGNWKKAHSILGSSAVAELGWGLRDDQVSDVGLARTFRRDEVLAYVDRGDIHETNAYAYASQALQLGDRLELNAALRYDAFAFRYDDRLDSLYQPQMANKGILSPKLNLSYQASPTLRLYAHAGTGFHSNDTRVVVRQAGREILPRAYGLEVGLMAKPLPRMLLNLGLWGLDLDQEFVYVGDEGIVEPSGKTRRAGVDVSLRYQLLDWLFADMDVNFSRPRSVEEAEGENFIPLSPTVSSIGGLSVETPAGLGAALRYRYLAPRPANESWTLTAEGYTLLDATVTWTFRDRLTLGAAATNLLNQRWNEAQFETESRLANESAPVSEIHFTPGSPRALRTWISLRF